MKRISSIFLTLLLLIAFSCSKDSQSANPVPYVTVSVTLNMDNPLYTDLNRQGGYIYLDNEGNKGIIVVHDFSDVFWAFDRTCPYHINSACGKIIMSNTGLNLVCGTYAGSKLNACCDSKYSLDGNIMNGPTTFPLRRYQVNVSGSVVTIVN